MKFYFANLILDQGIEFYGYLRPAYVQYVIYLLALKLLLCLRDDRNSFFTGALNEQDASADLS